MIAKFTVHVAPKRMFLAKELALWFAFKNIDYTFIQDEIISAQVPIELMGELGMISAITVKYEHKE